MSRFNEISDDCCEEFVVDFAEMASAHDTVSDGSVIGAEFDDSRDFRPESDSYLSTRLIDTGDSSLPATTGYHKI